jgi:hypothetical protein
MGECEALRDGYRPAYGRPCGSDCGRSSLGASTAECAPIELMARPLVPELREPLKESLPCLRDTAPRRSPSILATDCRDRRPVQARNYGSQGLTPAKNLARRRTQPSLRTADRPMALDYRQTLVWCVEKRARDRGQAVIGRDNVPLGVKGIRHRGGRAAMRRLTSCDGVGRIPADVAQLAWIYLLSTQQ